MRFTEEQEEVIAHALRDRKRLCEERIDGWAERPFPDAARQVESISYWVRELLLARRTLVRAVEVFWA